MLKKTSSQLKQMARGILLGKYRYAIAMSMVANVIVSFISLLTASTATSAASGIINLFISFLLIFINALILVGQNAFYLNMACGNKYQITDLFEGFQTHPDKTIIVTFFMQLLTLLPLLPAGILTVWMTVSMSPTGGYGLIILCTVVLLLIGSIAAYWVMLAYSQVYYLLLDFPQYSARELMKLSRKLMKGNMMRLLYIQLSFLPLLFVGLFTFGIGFLFIDPYRQMTFVLFYLELLQSKKE